MFSYKLKNGQSVWESLHAEPSQREIKRNSTIATHSYFLLITCTSPLVFILDVIPSTCSAYSEGTQYWFKVLTAFAFIQTLANWLCCQFVSTHLKGTVDKPVVEKSLWEHDRPVDVTQHVNYCSQCQLVAPHGSKTHHCKECNRCILGRDHHCFLVGTCIGYYTQRYFVMFTFYIGIASCVGLYYCRKRVLQLVAEREDFYWTEHILPLTVKHAIVGRISILELTLIVYCYTFVWTGFMGCGFFSIQMVIIFLGLTFHEFKSDKKVRSYRTVSENFMEVFGPCWMANFLLPMQLIFKQKEYEQPLLPSKLQTTAVQNGINGINGHHQMSDDYFTTV